MNIYAPQGSEFEEIAAFAEELQETGNSEEVVIDFSRVKFMTPAWSVLVGGLLRQSKKEKPDIKRKAINFKRLSYAAHIGFFEYFGLNYGQKPDEAFGSDTYVPICIRRIDEVRKLASEKFTAVGDILHDEAERLSTILTRTDTGDLQDTLAYSIREILRNVVEHSEAEDFVFTAQYWPGSRKVEVVVADQGIGLATSLSENPGLNIANDEEALKQAILPGISSKAWRNKKHYDEWANSGYGLFMTANLCSHGGSFALISGGKMLRKDQDSETFLPFRWPGTVVVMQIDTEKIDKLSDRLAALRDEGAAIERSLKKTATGPSKASSSAKPSKWKRADDKSV
ncbi:ATP-binding protein [Rhizobium laguerreae]|uniref:ATP-binding protein n=1 Tax=Rhizobium laguerreae TaxID=1076926 RepID=UPI001C8FE3B0|nr:ATP-binding protein [Rhizobium laguerreae]MBY3513728.1 ATP-binding protein [Rhizobium laguerreae]